MIVLPDTLRGWLIGSGQHPPASAVSYIDYPAAGIYRYNTGGKLVKAGLEQGSFSVYD